MKIYSLLLIALCLSCHRDDDNLSIKVVDSHDRFKYAATFDRSKRIEVERFINRSIAPTQIRSDGDFAVKAVLTDETTFLYEVAPGELTITLDKSENRRAGYLRIKRMCEDLNAILNPKKKS